MMRTNRRLVLAVAAGALLAMSGCVKGSIDDPGSAQVELQVALTDTPAVTCSLQNGIPLFTVAEWSVTYNNVPKNELATTSPFNDIQIQSVTMSYDWPAPAAVLIPPDRTIPSPATVPVSGSASVKIDPILLQDLDPNMAGTSGIVTMTIHARTGAGQSISKTVGETLAVSACQGN